MKRTVTALVVLVLASCAREAPSPAQRPRFPNAPVILISIDTLRADHLPVYGYAAVETPNIDALAKDGIVFEKAWSHCPMTLPSHVSMLTGELPTTHGVRNNLGFRYDAAKDPSIAQRLLRSGYATGAAVSSYVLRGETGLREAFDWYDDAVDPAPEGRFKDYQRSGFTTETRAETWISSVAARPFFLLLHLYEPHVPYDPPEPFRSRYVNRYDGEIATADAIVGRFVQYLKQRKLYDDAIIILTSDHGEGLGDHGEQQHSILLYSEALRVPLLVKLPRGQNAGERIATPAALTDIAPMIAALTGIAPAKSDGIDALIDRSPREIYAETIYPYVQLGWSDLRSLISGDLHYIDSARPELYDMAADPREKNDVLPARRREAARMRAALQTYPPAATGDIPVNAEEAAKLAALGYVGSARQRPDPRTLPNPRDVIGTFNQIGSAFALADEHRYGEAEAAMKALLAANPRLADVRVKLAEMYFRTGRLEESIEQYRATIAGSAIFPADIAVSLGDAYFEAGKLDEAASAARAAQPGSPDKADALLVRIALRRRDFASAERLARRLAERPGAGAGDLLLLAEVVAEQGDVASSMKIIADAQQRAAATGERSVFGLEALRAGNLIRLGRQQEAVEAFGKEIALHPSNRLAYARLAVLYFTLGNRAGVEDTLQRLVTENPDRAAYELAARTMDAVEDVRAAKSWRARGIREPR